ncbi:MAG: glycerol-3-phosphate acyltransferase [Candidatus Thorarchaeota archaeon]
MEPIILIGIILLGLGSYLLGSICWAIVISHYKSNQDIRALGDKNPGAFNTGKNLGLKLGLLVMFLDMLKGLIPAIIATTVNFGEYQGWAIGVAGVMTLVGHCYPLYFNFKGGNGYSTIFGFMMIYHPWMVLEWGILVFILTLLFKYIRPVQLVAIVLTGVSGIFIRWPFYWWNLSYRMDAELAQRTIPITILVISLIQLPRFIPYFFGIFKGTEEKMHFFRRKRKTEQPTNGLSIPQE